MSGAQVEQLKRDVESKKTGLEQWSKTAFEEVSVCRAGGPGEQWSETAFEESVCRAGQGGRMVPGHPVHGDGRQQGRPLPQGGRVDGAGCSYFTTVPGGFGQTCRVWPQRPRSHAPS